jgi:hypothetical protein
MQRLMEGTTGKAHCRFIRSLIFNQTDSYTSMSHESYCQCRLLCRWSQRHQPKWPAPTIGAAPLARMAVSSRGLEILIIVGSAAGGNKVK